MAQEKSAMMFATSAGFISTLVAELPRLPGTPVPTLFVTALAATVCALCSPMALLDTFRYVNFIKEEETQNSTEGKNAGGTPRFNGEATRLGEYTWRVRARMAREAEMDPGEVKKQGPLGLRLVEQLSGPALRVAQQMPHSVLASKEGAEKLLDALATSLKPRRAQEARELYAAGAREGGILSRQATPPSRCRPTWSVDRPGTRF